jgi:hypothetical protein
MLNNPAGLSSRTPSLTQVIILELGQAIDWVSRSRIETPTGLTINGEPTGEIAIAEESGPSQGPG